MVRDLPVTPEQLPKPVLVPAGPSWRSSDPRLSVTVVGGVTEGEERTLPPSRAAAVPPRGIMGGKGSRSSEDENKDGKGTNAGSADPPASVATHGSSPMA